MFFALFLFVQGKEQEGCLVSMKLLKAIRKLFASSSTPEKRTLQFVRGKYRSEHTGDLSKLSARQVARNATYEEEVVMMLGGEVRRMRFTLDAYTSTRYSNLQEPFYLVIHRSKLTYEEEYFANVVFAKCPYFLGLVMKSNDVFYAKVNQTRKAS